MVKLEKVEANSEFVKYYYIVENSSLKGVLIYYPKTDTKKVEKYCEGDGKDSYMVKHRTYAFRRLKQYVEKYKEDIEIDEDLFATVSMKHVEANYNY